MNIDSLEVEKTEVFLHELLWNKYCENEKMQTLLASIEHCSISTMVTKLARISTSIHECLWLPSECHPSKETLWNLRWH